MILLIIENFVNCRIIQFLDWKFYVSVPDTMPLFNANANLMSRWNFNHLYRSTWNRGLVRILFPYFQNKNGTEHIASAMNASKEFPHPSPKASYIDGPA